MRPKRPFASANLSAFAFVFVAAIVAACGSGNSKNGFDVPDGGGSSSGGGGSSSSGGGTDGSVGSFGDGSTGKDSGPVVPPPKGCDSSCITAGGTCKSNVCVIVDNPGGVDPGTQTMLQGTGTADATFKWIYPYDGTVFPRGILPPTFQFDGTSADAMYIHITSAGLDYQGYFKPGAAPLRQALSAASWSAVVEAAGPLPDQLKVQVTKITGGQVSGPLTESWPVAQGNVRGTIYYETYGSAIGGLVAVMQINPGATAPVKVNLGPGGLGCGNICHTASADGSTLVAARGFGIQDPSGSFSLKTTPPTLINGTPQVYVYGALYPDGSLSMSATGYRTWISGASKLYDTATGANVPAPGWDGVITNAGVGSFSPDGVRDRLRPRGQGPRPHHRQDGLHEGQQELRQPRGSRDVDRPGDLAVVHRRQQVGRLRRADLARQLPEQQRQRDHHGERRALRDRLQRQGRPLHRRSRDPHGAAPGLARRLRGRRQDHVPAVERSRPRLRADRAARGGRRVLLGRVHQPPRLRQHAGLDGRPVVGQRRSGPALGGRGGHQRQAGTGPQPPRLLPGRAGEDGRQPARLLGAVAVPGPGRLVHLGRPVLRGLLPPRGRRRPLECVPPPGGCSNEYEKCSTASDCCQSSDQCINGFCAQPAAQ